MKNWPLEPDASTLRGLGEQCLETLLRLHDNPNSQGLVGAEALAAALAEPEAPERAGSLSAALAILEEAVPRSVNTTSGGYLAYIPGGGLFSSALGEMLARGTNRYVALRGVAPALAQLERNVIEWFCRIVGYPVGSFGVLTSGGSMANFSAVVTARVARLGEEIVGGVVYTSDQAHHSVAKAAFLAGIPLRQVRSVPSDAEFRLDVAALAEAVRADRAAGLRPFLVVGNAGSTNTGAVDPLDALADLCRREELWLHVDGAYGGFFCLTARGRALLRGLERADSITLDPHKSLFLPYGTGCLLAREGVRLREAHTPAPAHYLQDIGRDDALLDFADCSAEQSREARGLAVWLPLKLHGLGAFRDALDEKLDLAAHACERLSREPRFEILARPQLSALAFRLRSHEPISANRALLSAVNAEGKVFLSSTLLRSDLALRLCMLSYRTHREHVDAALEALLRLSCQESTSAPVEYQRQPTRENGETLHVR